MEKGITGIKTGLSPEDEGRFVALRSRAESLGVLDINFHG
jgi:hypothetical protein